MPAGHSWPGWTARRARARRGRPAAAHLRSARPAVAAGLAVLLRLLLRNEQGRADRDDGRNRPA